MTILDTIGSAIRGLFSASSSEKLSDQTKLSVPAKTEQRWIVATTEARDALKWLIGALAATSTVLFGAGPLLTASKIDVSGWEWWRFIAFFGGAVAGALGIIVVLAALLRSLLPTQLSLYEIPPNLVAEIDANWQDLLPDSAKTIAALRKRLIAYRHGPAGLRIAAETAPDKETREKFLAAVVATEESYRNYRAAESEILNQVGYRLTIRRVSGALRPVVIGAVIAVAGACAFLIATSPIADQPALKAEPALLSKGSGTAADNLWAQLGLDRCQRSDGSVAVLLIGGTGSENDPHVVKTLGETLNCPYISFNVPASLMSIAKPVTRTITVEVQEPKPSPSKT